jgi:hypothetical protein
VHILYVLIGAIFRYGISKYYFLTKLLQIMGNLINFSNVTLRTDEKGLRTNSKVQFRVQNFDNQGKSQNPTKQNTEVSSLLFGEEGFDFLQEAFLISEDNGVSSRCCYLKYNASNPGEGLDLEDQLKDDEVKNLFNPRYGTLLLPEDFRYVKFTIENDKVYTTLIIQLKNDEQVRDIVDLLHICKNSVTTKAIRSHCVNTARSSISQPFHIFYYEGTLALPGKSTPTKSKFYLIPLVLSDGLIIYYTIDKEDPDAANYADRINRFYQESKTADFWIIDQDLAYNDEKSVFFCTKCELPKRASTIL